MTKEKDPRRRAEGNGADKRALEPERAEIGEGALGGDGGGEFAELESAASLGSVPELLDFVREHPDVFELPDEVLEAVKGGKKLMQAYSEYENAKLRDELAAQKQNKRNAERTPGSVRSDAGESDELSELLAVFDSVFK